MAELTVTTFVSLDGVMQAPGGPQEDVSGGFTLGGWVAPHWDDAAGATMDEIFRKAGAFLLGRTTYDVFAGFWPQVTDAANTVAVKLNALPKYVASRTRSQFDWNNTTHINDVVRDLPAIKQRTQGELQVHGSAGLLQTLIKHDLVDEYRLLVYPVVLGSGKRLFGAGAIPANLSLVSSKTTTTGTVVNVYRRGKPFSTGAFTIEDEKVTR